MISWRISACSFACATAALYGLAAPPSAHAAPDPAPSVEMDSAVYVERMEQGNRRLEPAGRLSRGDRIVTILTWERRGGRGGFVITNPLPRAIAYQTSARQDQEVSVDGGRTWGQLADLRLGTRHATPEDVTHVRWRIAADHAASGHGHIAYSGIVR